MGGIAPCIDQKAKARLLHHGPAGGFPKPHPPPPPTTHDDIVASPPGGLCTPAQVGRAPLLRAEIGDVDHVSRYFQLPNVRRIINQPKGERGLRIDDNNAGSDVRTTTTGLMTGGRPSSALLIRVPPSSLSSSLSHLPFAPRHGTHSRTTTMHLTSWHRVLVCHRERAMIVQRLARRVRTS
jgi:hypothetical protein